MNTKQNEVSVEVNPNEEKFTGKVLNVYAADKFGSRRITVKTDQSFDTYDDKGNVVKTDSFTINSGQLLHAECDEPLMGVVRYKALGRAINKSVVAGFLMGSEIEFTRAFHSGGELNTNGVAYEKDCYTTSLDKVVCNIDETIKPFMINDIQNNLIEPDIEVKKPSSLFAHASAEIRL